MATELRTLCDFCLNDEIKADGEHLTITVNGASHEIDACPDHRKPLDELVAVLTEVGRKPAKPAAKQALGAPLSPSKRRVTCPMCQATYSQRGSLNVHTVREHGKAIDELEGKVLKYSCTKCSRAFATNQALAVHNVRSH